ncbi:MAG: hypothetical protein J7642_10180 [Cyanobacteria bacterium SBC]|nr:hypothetical protein [Cyanobacteria bacterium SBC]
MPTLEKVVLISWVTKELWRCLPEFIQDVLNFLEEHNAKHHPSSDGNDTRSGRLDRRAN